MNTKPSPRWLVIGGVLSVGSALIAHRMADWLAITAPVVRLVIALIPIPFFLAFIVAEFYWIRDQDEFHRRVVLESLAIAFPAVIAEAVTLEALQLAGFLTGVTIGDAWPFMALTWIPALLIAVSRYR